MNQFLPFQHVKGPIGFSNQLRNQSLTNNEGLSTEDLISDETIMPSFSDILQQVEDPKTQASFKEQMEFEVIDNIEPVAEIEEAIQPFLNVESQEIAEYLDTQLLTDIIFLVLVIPPEDQIELDQNDKVLQLLSKSELDRTSSNGSFGFNPLLSKLTKSIDGEKLFPLDYASLSHDTRLSNSEESLFNAQLNGQEERIEKLLLAKESIMNLSKQINLTKDPELVERIKNRVEGFLLSEDRTTLRQLINAVKGIVQPVEEKTFNAQLKLESSEDLEQLLPHLKVKDFTVKSGLLKENQLNQNRELVQHSADRFDNSQVKQAISNERSTLPEVKHSVTNEVPFSTEKTIQALEKNNQQIETLKAEGQAEERRFVKMLHRILHQGTLQQRSDGQTSFTLKLFPEHLGKLQIQVIQSGQKLAAQIIAESSSTRELVERSLPQLRQALLSQNVTFDQIDVDEYLSNDQHEQQEQEQSEDNDRQKHEQESRPETSFSFKALLEGLFS